MILDESPAIPGFFWEQRLELFLSSFHLETTEQKMSAAYSQLESSFKC